MNDLTQVCRQILCAGHNPRLDKQLNVEQAIIDFLPDLGEASEILDAVIAALNLRYRSDQLMVVEEEARALKVALKEAEPYEFSEEDADYDDHVQRQIDGD